MSHFSVLVKLSPEEFAVVGREGVYDAVYEKMIPYKEYGWGDPSPEGFVEKYCRFFDETDEHLKEWENGSTTRVVLPDGRLLRETDVEFDQAKPDLPDRLRLALEGKRYVVPEGLERRQVPFRELYPTFEEFMSEYCDMTADDKGRYGYWKNPNDKWDWFQIGGRWSGYLRVRADSEVAKRPDDWRGSRSLLSEEDELDRLDVDFAPVGQIDWDHYRLSAQEAAKRLWLQYDHWRSLGFTADSHRQICGDPATPFTGLYGTLIQLGFVLPMSEEDRVEGKFRVKDVDQDQFLLEAIKSSEFKTYAVLSADGWHESGEMGWWGMSGGDDASRSDWRHTFEEAFVRHERPDTVFVIVDGHI